MDYQGYAVYGSDNAPVGIISKTHEKHALCNYGVLPSRLKEQLVSIEDRRFYQHGALDGHAILRATFKNLRAFKFQEGASTITQQLARNILKDNSKTISRKIREVFLAFNLEKKHTKDEILELYFNCVFWGKRNYGIRSASLEYFRKEPEELNGKQQFALITLLRGPNLYLRNEEAFQKRFNALNKAGTKLADKEALFSKSNSLDIIKNEAIPHILKSVTHKRRTIHTTLNTALQKDITNYIRAAKYPTSVIAIKDGKVVGCGSKYGTDYPFTFRGNVGSTFKPFIYCYLRELGFESMHMLSTRANVENWPIREVVFPTADHISLQDALLISNNNAFVNAVHSTDLSKLYEYLAGTFNVSPNNFLPSSILGASLSGISLLELTKAYESFFFRDRQDVIRLECRDILQKIAINKGNLKSNSSGIFLKTGTTNYNRERYALVGYQNILWGFLRQENEMDDYSKEGNFISSVFDFLNAVASRDYHW